MALDDVAAWWISTLYLGRPKGDSLADTGLGLSYCSVGGSSVGFREPRLGRVATGDKPEEENSSDKIPRTSMKRNTAIPSGGHRTRSRGPHSPSANNSVDGGRDVDDPLKL